jgi:hypothetical protein
LQQLTPHLDPWHPDIECRTHDIEQNIRYRSPRYRMHIDIEDFYIRYRVSISNVYDIEGHIYRYRRSRKDSSISNFRIFRYRPNKFRYRNMISYTISKAFSQSISNINIGVDIVYDIIFTQVIHCRAEAPFTQAASRRRRRVSAPRALDSCTLFLRNSTA